MTSTECLIFDSKSNYTTSPNTTLDDDDESFYDAEADLIHKQETDEETDENKVHFFDTVTSRHTSESFGSFSTSSSIKKIDIPEILVTNSNNNNNNNNNNNSKIQEEDFDETNDQNEIEEENEEDPELETEWSFWFDQCGTYDSKTEYETSLKLIHTVKTVQTFWSIFNNIPDVSELPNRCSYHLMRNRRRPIWEDNENKNGGVWKFRCNKDDSSLVWQEMLLGAIGEQLSDCFNKNDDITGISVGRREKEDVIQIWNNDCKYADEAKIEAKIKQLVPNVKFNSIFYKPHSKLEDYQKQNVPSSKKIPIQKNQQNYYSYKNNYNKTKFKTDS